MYDQTHKDEQKAAFKRLWTREAINSPGLMVETVALEKDPILVRRPVMRKDAKLA